MSDKKVVWDKLSRQEQSRAATEIVLEWELGALEGGEMAWFRSGEFEILEQNWDPARSYNDAFALVSHFKNIACADERREFESSFEESSILEVTPQLICVRGMRAKGAKVLADAQKLRKRRGF